MGPLISTAAGIHERLRAAGATVAVAESLTGGRLCAALTETPGASRTMRGGLVVYATDLKASLAGVDAGLLAERGAVDPQVAAALADGARSRLSATFGLGVTGVAGPDPQDGHQVGTVFGAVAGPAGITGRAWAFDGDRAAIQTAAVMGCLQLLAEAVAAAGE
jgi:nicotinamide-nucleotide amidase